MKRPIINEEDRRFAKIFPNTINGSSILIKIAKLKFKRELEKEFKKLKIYQISYFFAAYFTLGFLVSFRYFDKEAAGFLIVVALVALTSAIINFKLNR
jgi:Gpi18-like mannosyltransferase